MLCVVTAVVFDDMFFVVVVVFDAFVAADVFLLIWARCAVAVVVGVLVLDVVVCLVGVAGALVFVARCCCICCGWCGVGCYGWRCCCCSRCCC